MRELIVSRAHSFRQIHLYSLLVASLYNVSFTQTVHVKFIIVTYALLPGSTSRFMMPLNLARLSSASVVQWQDPKVSIELVRAILLLSM